MILMRPIEWERMSWYARKRWMERNRVRPVVERPVVRVRVGEVLPEPSRCNECGAWMFDRCGTGHGLSRES